MKWRTQISEITLHLKPADEKKHKTEKLNGMAGKINRSAPWNLIRNEGIFSAGWKNPAVYAIFLPRFPLLIIRFPFAPTFVAGTKRGEVCVALNSFTSVSIQCVSKEVAMTLTYRVFLNYAVISYKNDKISHALRALIKSFKNSETYYSNTKGEKIHLPKT